MIARTREWLARLALLALSALVVLAGLEIWLRGFDRPWDLPLEPHPGSQLLTRLAPGSSGAVGGAPVRANSAGYRGPERERAKAPGLFRIALLGDSMTFGWGVRDDETFAARLEEKLRAARPADRWEVDNFAMIGFNTAQAAEAYLRDVAAYAPDLVLLGFFLNDVEPPVLAGPAAAAANAGGVEEEPSPRREPFSLARTLSRLRTTAFLKTRAAALARRLGVRARGSNVDRLAALFASRGEGWRACEEALRTLRDATTANGARFATVILPVMVSLDGAYPLRAAHEQIVATCRAEGIAVLDLLPAFTGRSAAALSVTPLDNHMNREGHEIAAQAIFEWLGASGLLPVGGSAP
jgi:lysophospholipase L1-like esterase